MNHHLPPQVVYTADLGALAAILGSFFGVLPGVAALLGATWYAILIWDRIFGRKDGKSD